jgi:hypothetical protein
MSNLVMEKDLNEILYKEVLFKESLEKDLTGLKNVVKVIEGAILDLGNGIGNYGIDVRYYNFLRDTNRVIYDKLDQMIDYYTVDDYTVC